VEGNGKRAVVTAAIALVVLTGGSLLWIACEPADRAGPSATPEPQATALPDGWVRCVNAEVGFSIGYPADWFTTDVYTTLDGSERPHPEVACSYFDPRPFVIPVDGEYPATALEAHLSRRPLATIVEQLTDATFYRPLSREELTIAGMPAVRLEGELVEGLRTGTRYDVLIDLGDGRTFYLTTLRQILSTGPTDPERYAANKAIVDLAAPTMRLEPVAT
jgi:hypothetical protein